MTDRQLTADKAMVRLEALCARSERCESEVRMKLQAWGVSPGESEAILRSLRERRFVDDARYAAAFVRDKYRFSHWGVRKIALALAAKRVAKNLVDDAISDIDHEEYEAVLRQLLKTKRAALGAELDFEAKNRLYRFAVGRGFEPQLVIRLIKDL